MTVIIVVEGGVVQDVVSTDENVTYQVLDKDNIEAGDEFDPEDIYNTRIVDAEEFLGDWLS